MTNGDSAHADGNNHSSLHAQAYPTYGYNENPPTIPMNLRGPPTGANIAAMAIGQQIPDSVVIANNHCENDIFASTISMPQSATVASNNPTPVMNSASHTPSIDHPFAATAAHQNPMQQQQQTQLPQTNIQPNQNRAIHRINLTSIRHNYNEVESSAAQQQCQVIVVVKADGYGHGAILTACHLVEHCGASAFAVATIEEGISLRRAFEEQFPHSPRVRILVLGAPVGYPVCFDTYLHNNIELMVSGPEVAASLAEWMKNHEERRKAEVEQVAEKMKSDLMDEVALGDYRHPMRNGVVRQISIGRGEANEGILNEREGMMPPTPSEKYGCCNGKAISTINTTIASNDAISEESCAVPPTTSAVSQEAHNGGANDINSNPKHVTPSRLQTKYNAATLTNVTGDDLAREVRQILIGQRHATANATQAATEGNHMTTILEPAEECNGAICTSTNGSDVCAKKEVIATNAPATDTSDTTPLKKSEGETLFCGIEDAARTSRQRELRVIRLSQVEDEIGSTIETIRNVADGNNEPQIRKKLRWHALVDSGMGRLGFKTELDEHDFKPSHFQTMGTRNHLEDGVSDDSISSSEHSGVKDTVALIKELYDAEVHDGAPIEFYGMCTHMADANSTSTYTHDQMERFRSLLHRVRSAGIAVPSISTDNSAALLTTSLTHFDPNAILAHDTRGYVRCGGAIYGKDRYFANYAPYLLSRPL